MLLRLSSAHPPAATGTKSALKDHAPSEPKYQLRTNLVTPIRGLIAGGGQAFLIFMAA